MRIILSMVMCLCALCGVQAQTIQNGSMWWDGSVLYTAKVLGNDVRMEGIGEHEGGFHFELTKVEGKSGEYLLAGKDYEAEALRAKVGWRVQYVRQEGMYFLAIRKPNGDAVWKMTLTPDNLENCLAQERYAEQRNPSELLSSWLMNTTYLGRFSKPQLRIMRNEILARHGWKFQSKDLQDYFESEPWYKPGNDNNAIKLNVIEQLNIQLIKSEEAVSDAFRSYNKDAASKPEQSAASKDAIVVTNEREFIEALAPEKTIEIARNCHLNLSRILEDEAYFRNVKGRAFTDDATVGVIKTPMVYIEECYDGRQLTLKNFQNLVIRGAGNSSIEVDPRYAFVINFVNCDGCVVENLTLGHTELGSCQGGVIGYNGGWRNVIKECDMYGCGTYGIDATRTSSLSVYRSVIHDCTYGILQLNSCQSVKFYTCDFHSCREFGLVECRGCDDIAFDDCQFYDNEGTLFLSDCELLLLNSVICHTDYKIGDVEMIKNPAGGTKYFEPDNKSGIKSRLIGPDNQ